MLTVLHSQHFEFCFKVQHLGTGLTENMFFFALNQIKKQVKYFFFLLPAAENVLNCKETGLYWECEASAVTRGGLGCCSVGQTILVGLYN